MEALKLKSDTFLIGVLQVNEFSVWFRGLHLKSSSMIILLALQVYFFPLTHYSCFHLYMHIFLIVVSIFTFRFLTKGQNALIELQTQRPVALELYKDFKELGRFMLRYSGSTIAAGVVTEVCHCYSGISVL